ncbi:MAG TPA: diacylglycerol kinase family protein [candidate division Zixibacteria bacterium]|nr:diacylglycerol kinase family protein [candidate division Zixibacteria bacterium]
MFANPQATNYRAAAVQGFAERLRAEQFDVEVITPTTAHEMVTRASDLRTRKPYLVIAAGGDGAVNLVARTLVGSPIRFAVAPLGRCNNFFRSLVGEPSPELALKTIVTGETRSIDCGKVSGLPFFCSVGLGALPALTETLGERSLPRFGLGWSRLAARAAQLVKREPTPVKVDSFRFNTTPMAINVSLLPYSLGLKFAPSAQPDDERFELTVDMSRDSQSLSDYVRDIQRGKCHFTDGIRLYRGHDITIGSVEGRKLYLDGEIIEIPTKTLDVTFYPKKLRVLTPPVQ